MMFVLDTNILSAIVSARPSPEVAAWIARQPALQAADYPSGRIRTRPGSMTEKLPAQSSPAVISAASRSPASSALASESVATRHHRCAAVPILWPVRRNPCQRSQDSMLARRPMSAPQGQHLRVGHAWRNDPDPHDIVPRCRQGGDRRSRNILVGEITQNQAALGNTFSELSVSRA